MEPIKAPQLSPAEESRMKALYDLIEKAFHSRFGKRMTSEEHLFASGFIQGQFYPSEETARKIWDAAIDYWRAEWREKKNGIAPDFETFYKQLIEGK